MYQTFSFGKFGWTNSRVYVIVFIAPSLYYSKIKIDVVSLFLLFNVYSISLGLNSTPIQGGIWRSTVISEFTYKDWPIQKYTSNPFLSSFF